MTTAAGQFPQPQTNRTTDPMSLHYSYRVDNCVQAQMVKYDNVCEVITTHHMISFPNEKKAINNIRFLL
jgi:hypothetical protein